MSGDPIPTPETVAADLAALLGADRVIADRGDMAPFVEEPRRRFNVPALAVVLPRALAEVQAVLRWANDRRVPVIPQGGNTGLVGGQVPLAGNEVILSLARLDAVREVDAEAGHMTVEAGLTLEAAQHAAAAAGMLFPLSIASQGSARIGGVLGSNAGGVQVLAYGNARELCLGVEAVLADGRLYRGLGSLRKNNTGYDLKNLLIGAEGTLGVITAATLKLYAQPEGYETAIVSIASPEAALELFALVRDRAGATLTAFELMSRLGFDIQLRHAMIERDPTPGPSPWYALVELSRPRGGADGVLEAALAAAFEAGLVEDAVLAPSLAARELMWRGRELISECQSREGASIKHDVAVPIAAIPALISRGIAAAEALVPGIRPCAFGHFGDGNIHFNFSQPVGADPDAFMAGAGPVHEAIYEIVDALGGTFSAEHGIGQLKTGQMRRYKDATALEMMRAIKAALDPNGILNPGKVLD